MEDIKMPKNIKRIEEKYVNISDVKSDGRNPNHMTKEQFQALKRNIEKYGFTVPIIVDQNLMLADGEHRLKAAEELGMSQVPAKILELNETQRRMLRQVMNKLKGTHNKDLDFEEYKFIYSQEEFETFRSLLPDIKEYEDILRKSTPREKDPNRFDAKKAAENPKYQVSVGDVYTLRGHRLMCGDSTNPDHVNKLMAGAKADMMFTDPPYGVSYTGGNTGNGRDWEMLKNDDLTGSSLFEFLLKAFINAKKACTDKAALYCSYATINHIEFEKALIGAAWIVKQVLVWDKGHVLGRSDYHWVHEPILYARPVEHNTEWFGDRTQKTILKKSIKETKEELAKYTKQGLVDMLMSIRENSDVVRIPKDNGRDYVHPTQKPVELPIKFIRNSTQMQARVLDLFSGSGVTLIACEQIHRRAYCMELDPKYASAIIERWENLTGEKGVKED